MGRPQAAEPSHHGPSKYCCGIFIKCSDSGPAGTAAGPACSPDQGWAAWEAGALLVHILNQKKLGKSHQVLSASQIVQGLGVPMERCCYLPVNWVVTDRRILLSWHIVLFILRSLDNKKLFTLGRKGGGPMWIQNVTKKAKNGSVSLRDIKPPAGKQRFQNISLRKKNKHSILLQYQILKTSRSDSLTFYAGFMLSYACLCHFMVFWVTRLSIPRCCLVPRVNFCSG